MGIAVGFQIQFFYRKIIHMKKLLPVLLMFLFAKGYSQAPMDVVYNQEKKTWSLDNPPKNLKQTFRILIKGTPNTDSVFYGNGFDKEREILKNAVYARNNECLIPADSTRSELTLFLQVHQSFIHIHLPDSSVVAAMPKNEFAVWLETDRLTKSLSLNNDQKNEVQDIWHEFQQTVDSLTVDSKNIDQQRLTAAIIHRDNQLKAVFDPEQVNKWRRDRASDAAYMKPKNKPELLQTIKNKKN
jgi:hypothetical protein